MVEYLYLVLAHRVLVEVEYIHLEIIKDVFGAMALVDIAIKLKKTYNTDD